MAGIFYEKHFWQFKMSRYFCRPFRGISSSDLSVPPEAGRSLYRDDSKVLKT
jgi:hypothetical protein